MTTPTRPAQFAAEIPPPGYELNLVSFWQERAPIVPRLQLAHTNGASVESNVKNAKAWAERRTDSSGAATTCPHFQVDRDGRAALLLPTNRKGIGNATKLSAQGGHGNVSGWSIVFETADTGYLDDPAISAFTDVQAEQLAIGFAYNAVLWSIPLTYPFEWYTAGSACHTEPFPYPYWTVKPGKICPGLKKKAQVRELVLPRARQIVAAWTSAPTPPLPPSQEEQTMYIVRDDEGRIRIGDGITQVAYERDAKGVDDKAVAFAITRAVRDGRPLRSDDGTRIVEVRDITDVLPVTSSAARSLGRGGTA